jgi:hypothetical protein
MRQQFTNLTVLDVYDEAALIGKDFERIIEGKCFFFLLKINFVLSDLISIWNGNYT